MMDKKLGISTSKGYNDKFSEVSSMNFGIGTIIISNWDTSILGTRPTTLYTKKNLTFYLPHEGDNYYFKTKKPDVEHTVISGTFVWLGMLDGFHLWQKVAK